MKGEKCTQYLKTTSNHPNQTTL